MVMVGARSLRNGVVGVWAGSSPSRGSDIMTDQKEPNAIEFTRAVGSRPLVFALMKEGEGVLSQMVGGRIKVADEAVSCPTALPWGCL